MFITWIRVVKIKEFWEKMKITTRELSVYETFMCECVTWIMWLQSRERAFRTAVTKSSMQQWCDESHLCVNPVLVQILSFGKRAERSEQWDGVSSRPRALRQEKLAKRSELTSNKGRSRKTRVWCDSADLADVKHFRES